MLAGSTRFKQLTRCVAPAFDLVALYIRAKLAKSKVRDAAQFDTERRSVRFNPLALRLQCA